ncbi:hypothetical protein ASG29_04045 [Sphingomonas sp. Leaf412]|uniref:autotransporter outer membrane beta-barrel domain-containing protein n=1 Tax=Sphingomonas sp. Leaf412 TaxID=1736370 RepID=UPI0006FC63E0|nr:autotransporter outer membrane beta-barrel domain-containing protein [Sphingomonas sp. Leaf412]KQT35281.1 hypothetical protein ASG29_04045 [Sphingomonas sp. Leaf412]
MKQGNGKARLCTGTATLAVVIALSASQAQAQCTTAASTVTCAGTVTASQVNAAIDATAPPSVTIRIQPNTLVTRDDLAVEPNNPPFNGAIDIANAGTLGTDAATVGFTYFGTPDAAANTLAFNNSGVITGQVFASGLGGTITAVNTGTLSGGLALDGSGNIGLTSSGPIYVATGGAGTTAVFLQSYRLTPTTTGTIGVDATTTNAATGGTAIATITAPVGIPATATTAAVPQRISLFGVGGAQLNLNAAAGAVTVGANAFTTTFIPGGGNTTVAGGTTTTVTGNTQTAVGGAASLVLGVDGRAASVAVTSGPGGSSASIAGVVGSTAAGGSVFATSNPSNTTFTNTSVNSATGASSQSSSSFTPVGGTATVDIAATGQVFGTAQASSNAAAAAVTVAGTVGAGTGTTVTTTGNVNATSRGTATTSTSLNSTTFATGDFSNTSAATAAATGAGARVAVASTGAVFGSATARGDTGATLDNAGRIRDGATAESARSLQTASQSRNDRVTTVAGTTTTVVDSNSFSSTNVAVGGSAALVNRAGAVIEDNVTVQAARNATIDNSGAIFGNVSVSATGATTTSANAFARTVATTPATAGGNLVRDEQVSSNSSTTTPTGGTVTGTYSGTVGAVAGSPLAGYRSVAQSGDAGSVATIGGTLYADVFLNSGTSASTSSGSSSTLTTTQAAVSPATGASETVTASTNRNTTTIQAADNVATITGSLRNNGFGTGDLSVTTQSGAASVAVTGGLVQGGISISAGGASNFAGGSDASSRSTRVAGTVLTTAPTVSQAASNSNFSESRGASGSATLSLTNNATVDGSVNVFGRGTGAGSTGASATIASGSTVGGFLNVNNNVGADTRSDFSSVSTRTGSAASTRVDRASTVSTVPTASGNSEATMAGRVGGAQIFSPFGNATASLTGQVTGGNSISLFTGRTLDNSASETTFAGTGTTGFGFVATTATSTSSSTYRGGSAALTINSAQPLQAAGTSAVDGSITVAGLAGSALSIAAGSRVAQTNAGSVFVGFGNSNTTTSTADTFNAVGTLSGRVSTTTQTTVGGPAVVTNAGIIGASTGYFGAPISVSVSSIGGASATNSGTIFGSIFADALTVDQSTTSTGTGLADAVTARTVAVTTRTGTGGAASVTNSGVVSGTTSLRGATGTLTNTGVLRGGVALGKTLDLGTRTQTTTATSSVLTAAAPATRFAQTYTVNQNGLLLGGVNVTGATIADPSTGAAANAVIRTSDITANVNLNNGSITTGNIVAQRAIDGVTRLTNTTLTLSGAGTLGVGTFDLPSDAVGEGTGPLRYVNGANYAAFAAIDPALGNSASGTFVPSVSIASGSRVLGVNLVEKTGAGAFTIVGNSYVAPSVASTLASYTMDVGTFRVSGGEAQLGTVGNDPVTGAATFGIRGNVEVAGGTLLLGRRVTDGATSVVEGTNLRVEGNYTQAAAGTLAVAVAPALIRSNGVGVGPLPAEGLLGFAGYGVGLSPFVAYDPTSTTTLRSTQGALTVTGNATLAGNITLATTPGAIYTAGRAFDLLTVNGTYSASGLNVVSSTTSPFVRFVVTPRTVGTSTVVSVDVARTSYASVTTTSNAAAAAVALDAAIPNVVTRLSAIRNPNAVADVQGYAQLQDLATVIAGLDTQLSAADASTALTQLGSGSFYGSLAAISTTAAFGEAADTPVGDDAGIGLWLRPTGSFARFDGSARTGAGALRADNYGGSLGVGISTGTGGTFAVAGGYGRIDARDRSLPNRASADTYMLGAYGRQMIGNFDVSAQAVFGWSNWDTTRGLPLFSRVASSEFDSKEFRFGAQVGYAFTFGQALLTPFAKIEGRRFDFGAFEEEDAGGIGLAVARRERTVVSPELGLRVGGSFGGIRPFVEGSYVFQGDVEAFRDVAFLGDRATTFRVQGVDPEGFAKLGAGVVADLYGASFSLRGNYLTGGGNSAGQVMGSIGFRF